jgi:hypothetical protein
MRTTHCFSPRYLITWQGSHADSSLSSPNPMTIWWHTMCYWTVPDIKQVLFVFIIERVNILSNRKCLVNRPLV